MSPAEPPSGGHVPFGRAVAGATPKQRLLFRLTRERVHLIAAYQGLPAARMLEAMGEGEGSVRDLLALLASWELAVVDALPGAQSGLRPAMMDFDAAQAERWGQQQLERTRALPLEEVVRGFQLTRLELLDRVEGMPEEPAALWQAEHPVGWMLEQLARRDVERAERIKRWRAEQGY